MLSDVSGTVKIFAAALLMAATAAGCGDGAETPEAEIRGLIAAMVDAAEDRDIGPLRDAISDRYADGRGQGKADIVKRMRLYLLQNRALLILPEIRDVTLLGADAADVRVDVRFAGAAADRMALRASSYQFRLELVREQGDWRIVGARWAEGGGEPR
jgi:hypothetical protein